MYTESVTSANNDVACPICAAPQTFSAVRPPYRSCPQCSVWFQHPPLAAKRYATDFEKAYVPSESDLKIYEGLAQVLYTKYLEPRASSGDGAMLRTLDVGAGAGALRDAFRVLKCDGYALDARPPSDEAYDDRYFVADFEDASWRVLAEGPFDLISLIHTFDRFHDPKAALVKLRELSTPDGHVFLRVPDHSQEGADRLLTPEAAEVRAFLFHEWTFLEVLRELAPLFRIVDSYTLQGAGQRDYVLTPIARRPRVFCGMIVKNEERDLPKCLESISSVVDEVFLIDTGSTDTTAEVVKEDRGCPVHYRVYTGASEQDETGDWKLWNFSQARNEFLADITATRAKDPLSSPVLDWILWMDADDVLTTPRNFERALYSAGEVLSLMMESSGSRWQHHRAWHADLPIVFHGYCHECPGTLAHRVQVFSDVVIRHDGAPTPGVEGSNPRNLRILQKEFSERPNPRTAFYLGHTYKDVARWDEAIEWYDKRIAFGEDYRDEWLFAWLHKARCERVAGYKEKAYRTLIEAYAKEPSWSEFAMELAYLQYERNQIQDAQGWALLAFGKPIPSTALWREPDKYRDQPARYISWAFEHQRFLDVAIAWAYVAKQHIAGPDKSWDDRIARLIAEKSGKPQQLAGPPPATRSANRNERRRIQKAKKR